MMLDDRNLSGKKRQKSGSVTPVATIIPRTIIMSIRVLIGKSIEVIVELINSVIRQVDYNAVTINNIYCQSNIDNESKKTAFFSVCDKPHLGRWYPSPI